MGKMQMPIVRRAALVAALLMAALVAAACCGDPAIGADEVLALAGRRLNLHAALSSAHSSLSSAAATMGNDMAQQATAGVGSAVDAASAAGTSIAQQATASIGSAVDAASAAGADVGQQATAGVGSAVDAASGPAQRLSADGLIVTDAGQVVSNSADSAKKGGYTGFAGTAGTYASMAVIQLVILCCLAKSIRQNGQIKEHQPFGGSGSESDDEADFPHGVCECFDDCETCLCAWCCPAVRMTRTVYAAGLTRKFWTAAILIIAAFMINGVVPIFGLVVFYYRRKLRVHVGSHAGCCKDLLCSLCCTWCVIAQEARYVDEALDKQNDNPAANFHP